MSRLAELSVFSVITLNPSVGCGLSSTSCLGLDSADRKVLFPEPSNPRISTLLGVGSTSPGLYKNPASMCADVQLMETKYNKI